MGQPVFVRVRPTPLYLLFMGSLPHSENFMVIFLIGDFYLIPLGNSLGKLLSTAHGASNMRNNS